MTTVDIKLDGTSIIDDVLIEGAVFSALADGQAGTCTFTIRNENGQYAPTDFTMGQTVELYLDGQREWDGWLFDFKRTWPFEVMDTSDPTRIPRYWKLRGFDRNLLFQKRVLYDLADPDNENGLPTYPATTTDQTALLDICSNYVNLDGTGLSTSGIKEVASPGQGGEFLLGYVGGPWGLAFDDCAKMSGAVFYIDADRVIHYRGDTDVNAPWDLTDNPGAADEGYADFLWTDDFSDGATEALVWGAGYGSKFPVFKQYEGDIATYGRWQWADLFIGAYKQATVNKRARTYIEGSPSNRRGHGEPVPVVTLTQYKPGMRCGMVANVISEVHELSRALPCRRLDISFPSPTAVKMDMEFTLKVDEPFSSPDLWRLQDYTDKDTVPTAPDAPPDSPTVEAPSDGNLLIDDFDVDAGGLGENAVEIFSRTETVTTPAVAQDILLPNTAKKAGDLVLLMISSDHDGVGTGDRPAIEVDHSSLPWSTVLGNAEWQYWWITTSEENSDSNHWYIRHYVTAAEAAAWDGTDDSVEVRFYNRDAGLAPMSRRLKYHAFYVPVEWLNFDDPADPTYRTVQYDTGVRYYAEPTYLPMVFNFNAYDQADGSGANLYLMHGKRNGSAAAIDTTMKEDATGTADPADRWTQWDSAMASPEGTLPAMVAYSNIVTLDGGDGFGEWDARRLETTPTTGLTSTISWGINIKVPTATVQSSGTWTNGDGDITIALPSDRPVGKFLVVEMAWDGYHIPTGPYTNLAVGLWDDPKFWLPMSLIGTGEVWRSPDFEHAVYYRRIVGDEGNVLQFTPDSYEEVGQTASGNWVAVAHVQDLLAHDVDTQYLNRLSTIYKTSFSSALGMDVPEDGYWRSLLSIMTNSTDVTRVPTSWTYVGKSEVAGEVEVFSYVKDWGFQSSGFPIETHADWPNDSAFANGINYYHHLVNVAADADPPIPDGGVKVNFVTPGPSITDAPWAGGNPYRDSWYGGDPVELPGPMEISDSVVRDDASGLYLFLHDSPKWLTVVGWDGDSAVGEDVTWDDTYGDPPGGWSTRFWAKEGGFESVIPDDDLDIIIKWRYTGATPSTTTYLRCEWVGFSIPDDLDPEDIWIQSHIYYVGGNYHGLQSWLNVYDNERTYPSIGWASEGGEWMWPYHVYATDGGLTLVEDQWYYTRLKVGAKTADGWGYPYNGGAGPPADRDALDLNLSGMKTWPVGEEEPTSGGGTNEWYWNYPSYPPADPPPVSLDAIEVTETTGWDMQLPSAWYKNYSSTAWGDDPNVEYRQNTLRIQGTNPGAGKFEVDGIWRYGGGTTLVPSVTSSEVAEVPKFTSSQTATIPNYSVYQTRYPYKPGTLVVHVDGSVQGPGDMNESNPATGEFVLFDSRDRTDSMYVTYTRASAEANWESGIYRPDAVLQYGWGTRLDGYNCNMAAGCMALDRHTLGAYTSVSGSPLATPPNMRSYQYDQSEGTDLGDLATAWSNGWSQTFSWGVHSWATFLANIRAGKGAVLQGLYGNLPPAKRFSDTFTGGHSLYINDEIQEGFFWGRDPLTSGAVVYSAAELQSYAQGLSWVGAGEVSAGYTQVT